jgi:AraC-like DNA-binding protein
MSQTTAIILNTTVSHQVRTSMVREDMIGYIRSGNKRLLRPNEEVRYQSGEFFLIARGTQWDMLNEVQPLGTYSAHVMSFKPELIEQFHERFAQFSTLATLTSCAKIGHDKNIEEVFLRAFSSLKNPEMSPSLSEHRVFELLLLLAEQGWVFSRNSELSWSERVRRLVAQRPHATWSVKELAESFHLSASSLQRRLENEGCTLSDCVREVRLESALLLLQSSSLAISEIAHRSGYASHSRFSAAFRERFGFTPSHLRPTSTAQHASMLA